MLTTSLALASLGALACAVVYGTDVFAAIVLRPALAALDDEALVQAAGRIHQYADQRMPLPGAAGTLAAAAATLTASLAGHPLQAGLSGGALVALLAWLMLYLRVAAPINRELTRAAAAHRDSRKRAGATEPLGQHHRPARRPTDHRACTARERARVHMSTPRSRHPQHRRPTRVNTYPASPNFKDATCKR